MSSVPEDPIHFGLYIRSIFRWKASVYKLIWKEFIIYMLIYLVISLIYQLALTESIKADFDAIAAYCTKYTSTIPILLLLGFFTSTSMQMVFYCKIYARNSKKDAVRIERLFYNCESTDELVNTSIQSRSYWEEYQPRREYTETDPMLTVESRVGEL